MTSLQVADLVDYPRMPDWGPGKVIHLGQDLAHVFFRDAEGSEAKKLRPDQLVRRENQSDAMLDHLPPFRREKNRFVLGTERVSPTQALTFFLTKYPGGFQDPGYLKNERTYKLAAHERFVSSLGDGQLRQLVDRGDGEELTKRIVRVTSGLNLLFPTESAAFREAIDEPASVLRYGAALADLLAASPLDGFGKYCVTLSELRSRGNTPPNKWPIATLLPFLAQPRVHVFVKPLVFQEAAARFAFDIKYESTPNAATYTAMLRLTSVYWDVLERLRPVDLIDVQSFLWVVSSAFTAHVKARQAPEKKG